MLEIVEIGYFELQVARGLVMRVGYLSEDVFSMRCFKDEIAVDHAPSRALTG